MKVLMNGYEIEVKAKGIHGTKYNDIDTQEFLLELSHIFMLAKETVKEDNRIQNNISKNIDNIQNVLLKNGFDYHRF